MRPHHRDMLIAYWMLFDEIPTDEQAIPTSDSSEKDAESDSSESSDRQR